MQPPTGVPLYWLAHSMSSFNKDVSGKKKKKKKKKKKLMSEGKRRRNRGQEREERELKRRAEITPSARNKVRASHTAEH